ncbi:Hypothetical predicted protein, partial [Paramuricea clavata]
LIILDDNEQYLKRKLSSLVNTFECDEVTNVSNSSSVSKVKVCEHTDNCINRDIIAQLEGVKLDLKTLESRLFTSISQQESKFDDINSMHVKQKEMESTIKQKKMKKYISLS